MWGWFLYVSIQAMVILDGADADGLNPIEITRSWSLSRASRHFPLSPHRRLGEPQKNAELSQLSGLTGVDKNL